ncbi:ferric reductase NAD binding domain-containing protein [Phellopilus nigrolimitatus]|nr:ferric reductase NAD binding domain-containing protein [Phellopilus nigrolimitatus]
MRSFHLSILSRSEPTPAEIALKAAQQKLYVEELWLFLTAIIGILTIANWSMRLLALLRERERLPFDNDKRGLPFEKRTLEASDPGRTGKVSLRRFPDAFASSFRNIAFRTTVPIGPSSVMSVAELSFVILYIVALLIWLWVDTKDMDTFYFQDRAAHFASCQLPLVVALAGKNNIISFLTGVSHEKLNVLHRASARACLILLWIHTVVHGASGLPEKFGLALGWMRWGVAGLTAFTLATILSIRPIRIRFFEFFLISHIILICIFLVGGFIHAKNPGFGNYIWPALLVWGVDRSLRLGRLVWNNRIWSRKAPGHSHASIELLTHDTIRLTLRRKMRWAAGQHAYIILPSVSNLPTEAHPFTIASTCNSLDGRESSEKDVVFIIRGRTGFAKRLRDHASSKGASSSVPAYIDGPYGCPPDLKGFSTCVLIAGGSGVSYTLPLLLDLVYHARKGTTLCQRTIFVWVVREQEHLNWISKLLTTALVSAPPLLIVEPRIYITSSKAKSRDLTTLTYNLASEPSSPSSASGDYKLTDVLALSSLKTRYGRPDVQSIIEDAVSVSAGPVSVDVAGPSSLAAAIREALASDITSPISVMKGRPTVTLHVETFGMVKG